MAKTIEDVLNRINGIFKAKEYEVIEDEEMEKSEDYEEELGETDEPVEDDELEKSEDEEVENEDFDEPAEEEYEDEFEEDYEDEEDSIEVDYEELVSRIEEAVMDRVEARLAELEAQVIDGFNAQTDAIETTYEKSLIMENDLKKAFNVNFGKLEKIVNSKARKSVDNIQVIDKFKEEAPSIDALSKSEKASILNAEILAGNTTISPLDVTNVELGGEPSETARKILEKAVRK